jgi:hypothetical protein
MTKHIIVGGFLLILAFSLQSYDTGLQHGAELAHDSVVVKQSLHGRPADGKPLNISQQEWQNMEKTAEIVDLYYATNGE